MKIVTKSKRCFIAVLTGCSLLVGCIGTRDLSSKASKYTDYVIGQTYELKSPVFLHKYDREDKNEIPTLNVLGSSGTSTKAETFSRDNASNPQVVGLLHAGQKLGVFKIVENNSPTIGPYLHVHAKVIGGALDNQIVDLVMISQTEAERNRIWINSQVLGVTTP